jgi:hypothetical protein
MDSNRQSNRIGAAIVIAGSEQGAESIPCELEIAAERDEAHRGKPRHGYGRRQEDWARTCGDGGSGGTAKRVGLFMTVPAVPSQVRQAQPARRVGPGKRLLPVGGRSWPASRIRDEGSGLFQNERPSAPKEIRPI